MCENEATLNIEIVHAYGASPDPLKIKIEKNSKGYNWEVSASGSDMADILLKLRAADAALRSEYGSG